MKNIFSHLKKQLKRVGMHVEPHRKAIDVVCGMELDSVHTKLHEEYRREVYYFCSTTCKNHFTDHPERYVV